MSWQDDSRFESDWWGNCCNTFGEEYKQLAYAEKMGLKFHHNGKSPFNIDMQNKTVLDIGGGPVSLLLKCENVFGAIIDPCNYPEWIYHRYKACGIDMFKVRGEDLSDKCKYDEVWIYNCLQHVEDPIEILKRARAVSKVIRVFEWIENGISEGHPHNLTEEFLNEHLGGFGKVEWIDKNTAKGKCYYGIFKGDRYE